MPLLFVSTLGNCGFFKIKIYKNEKVASKICEKKNAYNLCSYTMINNTNEWINTVAYHLKEVVEIVTANDDSCTSINDVVTAAIIAVDSSGISKKLFTKLCLNIDSYAKMSRLKKEEEKKNEVRLSPKQIADVTGLNKSVIIYWCKKNKIEHEKLNDRGDILIPLSALIKYMTINTKYNVMIDKLKNTFKYEK